MLNIRRLSDSTFTGTQNSNRCGCVWRCVLVVGVLFSRHFHYIILDFTNLFHFNSSSPVQSIRCDSLTLFVIHSFGSMVFFFFIIYKKHGTIAASMYLLASLLFCWFVFENFEKRLAVTERPNDRAHTYNLECFDIVVSLKGIVAKKR